MALFDIDGTLVSGGPAKSAFCGALSDVFGAQVNPELVNFAGKTDPQIARELLSKAGVKFEIIEERLAQALDRYVEIFDGIIADDPPEVLPGVRELLAGLEATGGVGLALLTGNVLGGARLKLGAAGLADCFEVGAFGSDDADRNALPAIALSRARREWGGELAPRNAIVIGDTPRDVVCGRRAGIETLGVATGHYTEEELWEAGADRVFPDLSSSGVFESIVDGVDAPAVAGAGTGLGGRWSPEAAGSRGRA